MVGLRISQPSPCPIHAASDNIKGPRIPTTRQSAIAAMVTPEAGWPGVVAAVAEVMPTLSTASRAFLTFPAEQLAAASSYEPTRVLSLLLLCTQTAKPRQFPCRRKAGA